MTAQTSATDALPGFPQPAPASRPPNIMSALAAMHPKDRGWVFVPEMRNGTGFGSAVEQRMDAWAIQCWSRDRIHNLRRSFEVKLSASDLRRELLHPDKRWRAYSISHEFYFVAPVGLIDRKLLTRDDGLIEWDGAVLKVVKAPRVREAMPPRWDFVASLARTLSP